MPCLFAAALASVACAASVHNCFGWLGAQGQGYHFLPAVVYAQSLLHLTAFGLE